MRFIRGTTVPFEADFIDVDGEPMVPADQSTPVTVQIKDPAGTVVKYGVGAPTGKGRYRFMWFVPEDAELNTDERRWRIDWFMVTYAGHNKDISEEFDVVDKVEAKYEDRQWTLLTMAGTQERVSIQRTSRAYEIGLDIRYFAQKVVTTRFGRETDVTESDLNSQCLVRSNPQRKIGREIENGQYRYFFDTDALNEGEYVIFWKVRDSSVSETEYLQRNIKVPESNFWLLNMPLRILVDKLHKKIGLVQSYATSDMYDYIQHGLGYVNMIYPETDWTLSQIPVTGSNALATSTLIAAAIWALQSQQILEIELNFSHGGQTVTLEYNHDYSGVISALGEMLNKFAEAKKQIFRRMCGVARSGVRPKNFRYTNRVWRVGNFGLGVGAPYDTQALLAQVGLY